MPRTRSTAAPPRAGKIRLDALLVERGLYETRSQAAAAVLAGGVRLGAGRRAEKPGQLVPPDQEVAIAERAPYASRGGVKLANALDAFGVDPAGRRCMDVGASTGGFSDVMLQRGAEGVVAVDVAYGELAWRLRGEPRVTVLERTNARDLSADQLPYRPDLIAIDVSFISIAKVLEPVVGCAAARFDLVALVKPQFEVGRGRVGKGGVVRSAALRREALVEMGRFARERGWAVLGYASSGLPGPAGNRESFVWIAEPGREGDIGDFEAAAGGVEA